MEPYKPSRIVIPEPVIIPNYSQLIPKRKQKKTSNRSQRKSILQSGYVNISQYQSRQTEDFIENNQNIVQSIVLENDYFSQQISEKNQTMKFTNRGKKKKKHKNNIIKQNIYEISRMTKTQTDLARKSRLNAEEKKKKKVYEKKQSSFSPMLNRKSLIIASQLKKKLERSKSRKLVESEEHLSNYEGSAEKNSYFFYNPSKKGISTIKLTKERGQRERSRSYKTSSDIRLYRSSFTPSINKKSRILDQRRNDGKTREQSLYEDHKKNMKKKLEKKSHYYEAKEEEETRECSFRPQINQSNHINYDNNVEERLIHWDKKKMQKISQHKEELLLQELEKRNRPKKKKVKTDLSYLQKESVQKSISKFLHRQEFSRLQEQKRKHLEDKHVIFRSYITEN